MPIGGQTILDLLNRAAADREFLQQLAAQPLETARAEGVEIASAELKLMLGVPGATDEEFVEMLRVRLRNAAAGCDPCDEDCTLL